MFDVNALFVRCYLYLQLFYATNFKSHHSRDLLDIRILFFLNLIGVGFNVTANPNESLITFVTQMSINERQKVDDGNNYFE